MFTFFALIFIINILPILAQGVPIIIPEMEDLTTINPDIARTIMEENVGKLSKMAKVQGNSHNLFYNF